MADLRAASEAEHNLIQQRVFGVRRCRAVGCSLSSFTFRDADFVASRDTIGSDGVPPCG